MKANIMTKLAASVALSIALAFGATAIASAEGAAKNVNDPCLKIKDEAACAANEAPKCRWLPARTVNGKEVSARCRTKPKNPCLKLDEAACKENADKRCAWVTDAVNKKGKPRKPFCRRMPKK